MERPALQLDVARVDDVATVAVAGEIDLYTAASLEAEAMRALEPPVARLILDLARVGFCDSQGLAVLVRIDRQARAGGATLTIANPTRIVARVMQITGLDQVLHVVGGHPDSAGEQPTDRPAEEPADTPAEEPAGPTPQQPVDRGQQS